MRDPIGDPARVILAALAAAAIVLGLGYLLDVPAATATWPFAVTRITYIFLASVTIAFAAPVAWVARTGDIAALAGIGLTVAVAYGLVSLVFLTLVGENFALVPNLALAAAVTLVGAAGFVAGVRRTPADRRVTPAWVRVVFVASAAILLLTGGAMLLRVPNVLPWNVDLATQQLAGAVFVGNAGYFLYSTARPVWSNAAGTWLAFLAYDLVLVIPLVNHFAVVRDEHRLGLILYVSVVAATIVLSVWSLAIDRRTRIVGQVPKSAVAAR